MLSSTMSPLSAAKGPTLGLTLALFRTYAKKDFLSFFIFCASLDSIFFCLLYFLFGFLPYFDIRWVINILVSHISIMFFLCFLLTSFIALYVIHIGLCILFLEWFFNGMYFACNLFITSLNVFQQSSTVDGCNKSSHLIDESSSSIAA